MLIQAFSTLLVISNEEVIAVGFYPVALNVTNRRVTVVGSGPQADCRIAELVQAGAELTVVSPQWGKASERWQNHSQVTVCHRALTEADLQAGGVLFVTDTERHGADAVRLAARQRGAWMNVADVPELCDFYTMAQLRRGELVIAVSTSGRAPALAREIREQLETIVGPEWREQVDWAAQRRVFGRKQDRYETR